MIIDPVFDIYFETAKGLRRKFPRTYKGALKILSKKEDLLVVNRWTEIDPEVESYFCSFSSWSPDEHQGVLETIRTYECPRCNGDLDGLGECEYCCGTGRVETLGKILRNQYGEALKEIK